MLGIGRWSLDIAIPLVKVNPMLIIEDNNGEYNFSVDIGGFGASPAVNLISCEEEGNTLHIKHTIPMLTNGTVEASLTFDGMYCKGVLEIPMLGKITVNGVKVGN